jgi:alpha-L-rhamnosidase
MAKHYERIRQYDTGIFGTDIVTRVLFDHGYAQLAYDLLAGGGEASYENMRRHGATTLWEYWNGHRSHSHPMFGAAARYLFRDLLGITQRPGTAGFTDLILRPRHIPGLRCKGHITNAFGKIEVAVEDGQVSVTLPEGTKAEVAQ